MSVVETKFHLLQLQQELDESDAVVLAFQFSLGIAPE